MAEVTAILLAAGLSRRMGNTNKLLMPVGGMPMIRLVAEVYLAVADTKPVVVTGFEADKVRDALAGLSVTFVHNPNFAHGQPGSVATGLRAAPDAQLLLIGLADQPRLTSIDLNDLIRAHRMADPERVTIPMRDMQRGNPIVVPRSLRAELMKDRNAPGCMRFTRTQPEHVQAAPLAAQGFYHDIDTPDDYAALLADEVAT